MSLRCNMQVPLRVARHLRVEHMGGQVPYLEMLARQEERHRDVLAGVQNDTLILLEHAPVVTLGRNSNTTHVLLSQEALKKRGVSYCETGRGGDVTYHGPGQLVGYPIVALQEHERDVRAYVSRLEDVLIRTVSDFGIVATREEGLRGIWVGKNKLAAVGVRLSRWGTMHGLALNITTDVHAFDVIVPCGIRDRGVTSMALLLGNAPAWEDVEARVVFHFERVFERFIGDVA